MLMLYTFNLIGYVSFHSHILLKWNIFYVSNRSRCEILKDFHNFRWKEDRLWFWNIHIYVHITETKKNNFCVTRICKQSPKLGYASSEGDLPACLLHSIPFINSDFTAPRRTDDCLHWMHSCLHCCCCYSCCWWNTRLNYFYDDMDTYVIISNLIYIIRYPYVTKFVTYNVCCEVLWIINIASFFSDTLPYPAIRVCTLVQYLFPYIYFLFIFHWNKKETK